MERVGGTSLSWNEMDQIRLLHVFEALSHPILNQGMKEVPDGISLWISTQFFGL
jgi:hypothetical protein